MKKKVQKQRCTIQTALKVVLAVGVIMGVSVNYHVLHHYIISSLRGDVDAKRERFKMRKQEQKINKFEDGSTTTTSTPTVNAFLSPRVRIVQYEMRVNKTTKQVRRRREVVRLSDPSLLPSQGGRVKKGRSEEVTLKEARERDWAMAAGYETPLATWSRAALEEIQEKAREIAEGAGECLPMHEWMTASYPTCNAMHELDTSPDTTLNIINCGYSRCAFSLKTNTVNEGANGETDEETLVLKVFK
jgi:hypothetical protein